MRVLSASESLYRLFCALLLVTSVAGSIFPWFNHAEASALALDPIPEITEAAPLPTIVPRAHSVRKTRNHTTRKHKTHSAKDPHYTKVVPSPPPVTTTTTNVQTTPTTSTPTPTPPPPPPPTSTICDYTGCFGSAQSFPNFNIIDTTGKMTVELCTSECISSGYAFSGLRKNDCYCASSIQPVEVEVDAGYCSYNCPGKRSENCGGRDIHGPHVKNGPSPRSMIFDVYSCSVSTATQSSTSSASTPDPSADMFTPVKERGFEELSNPAKPLESRDYARLARGGVFKAAEKKQQGNVLVKKDFGVKKFWWSTE